MCYLGGLGADAVDAADAHGKDDLGLGLHVEVARVLGHALQPDLVLALLPILLHVLLCDTGERQRQHTSAPDQRSWTHLRA